ncbi:hypothetical protein WJX79_003666 [Trebouxia sp. C0005]
MHIPYKQLLLLLAGTPLFGVGGSRGPADEETGLTGGVAVGVQEGAAAARTGTGATTLLALGVPAGILPPERPGVCLGRLLGPLAAGVLSLGGEPWVCGSLTASLCLHSLGTP